MDLREVERLAGATVELRHPWEEARADFFLRVLEDDGLIGRSAPAIRVLDCGAGDGYVGRRLRDRLSPGSDVVCWDASYDDARLATKEPGIRFVREVPDERFDVLLLLDVLEHVADDAGFLADVCRRHAELGATVVVSVPAWGFLFSAHDRFLHHFRRYAPEAARAVLHAAGLEIVRSGGLFHAPLLVRFGIVVAERWLGERKQNGVAGWRSSGMLRTIARAGLAAETRMSWMLATKNIPLPGLSFFALCRARGDRR
jgi:SAM-dependent methyltransferase